jgi:hypothetical protein
LIVLFIYNPDAEDETRETFQGRIDLPKPKAQEGIRVSLLGIERGESGEVEVMDPSRRGGVEGHLPELHVLHHELVGALHVVERPPGVILAQILDEDLAGVPKTIGYNEIPSVHAS